MDHETIQQVIRLLKSLESDIKKNPSFDKKFECENTREFQAYLKGRQGIIRKMINRFQKYQLKSLEEQALDLLIQECLEKYKNTLKRLE